MSYNMGYYRVVFLSGHVAVVKVIGSVYDACYLARNEARKNIHIDTGIEWESCIAITKENYERVIKDEEADIVI